MDGVVLKAGGWLALAILALVMAALAVDAPFAVHMGIVAIACLTVLWATVSRADFDGIARGILKMPGDEGVYDDDPIRWGVIATLFWGTAGFLAGLYIALQLAYPALNLGFEYTTFGRLRPLHTSAVIFAFGGNALIATSFYVVQRTCRARLALPSLARFVFWGYQLFIVLAATGYLMGVTEGKEYAEPEWYVDLWLTIVWVAYLAVFVGTIIKRREPHIYVANWFYLSFILTIAMLHIVNNLSLPATIFGSKSVDTGIRLRSLEVSIVVSPNESRSEQRVRLHREMLDNGPERERREECQPADDEDDADHQADEQAAGGRESTGRGGDAPLLGKGAGDRHRRNDHEEAADEHRDGAGDVEEHRVGRDAGESRAVIAGA